MQDIEICGPCMIYQIDIQTRTRSAERSATRSAERIIRGTSINCLNQWNNRSVSLSLFQLKYNI